MQQFYCFIFFKIFGWRMLGEPPQGVDKYLLVVLPHTSNWDFPYGWLATKSLGLNVKIFAKDAYFFWPLKYVCQWLGLLPVNRRESTSFVDTMVEKFEQAEELHLFIAPEGTRSYVEDLKSGYYYLAKKANVPIVVAGPNFAQKTFVILPPRQVLASFEEDQQQLKEFAKGRIAKRPNNTFR